MTKQLSILLPAFILVATGLQFGCAKSLNPESESSATTPDPTMTPIPPLTPAGDSVMPDRWIAVRAEYVPEKPDPKGCTAPFRMKIESNGAFTAGPCTPEDYYPVEGKLTAEEIIELHHRADPMTETPFELKPRCESGASKGSEHVGLYVPPNSEIYVYENGVTPKKLCVQGKGDQAKTLAAYMHVLFRKYYPQPQPR